MNFIYPTAREKFLSAQINWPVDAVVCVLVSTVAYTYSPAHETLADVPAAMRLATSGTLTNRTATLGVADADDVTFGAFTGPLVNAAVLYVSSGTDLTSPLIAYYDQAAGLPANPASGAITVVWDNGTNRLFVL